MTATSDATIVTAITAGNILFADCHRLCLGQAEYTRYGRRGISYAMGSPMSTQGPSRSARRTHSMPDQMIDAANRVSAPSATCPPLAVAPDIAPPLAEPPQLVGRHGMFGESTVDTARPGQVSLRLVGSIAALRKVVPRSVADNGPFGLN